MEIGIMDKNKTSLNRGTGLKAEFSKQGSNNGTNTKSSILNIKKQQVTKNASTTP